MPGGGKGPSSSGNITQTTVNPTQAAQLPFLRGDNVPNGGWNAAAYNAEHNPIQYYPGQTRADDNPATGAGYDQLLNRGWNSLNSTVPAGDAAYNYAVGGGMGVQNSPASPLYNAAGANASGLASGTNSLQQDLGNRRDYATNVLAQNALQDPYSDQLRTMAYGAGGIGNDIGAINDYGGQAASNPYASQLFHQATGGINGLGSAYGMLGSAGNEAGTANAGTRGLEATARGDFLGKNPYIDAQYKAASDPVTRQYMTATAPQTESNYEAAGRYGSGVLGNARSQNEQNLGHTLGDLGANLYGNDYANERGLMTGAASSLGSLINSGIGLRTAAGAGIGNLGLGELSGRANTLNAAGNQYLSGIQTNIGAQNAAGNLAESDFTNKLGARRSAYDATMGGYNAEAQARTAAGNLGLGFTGSMIPALGGLQSGYQAGNSQALQGLALEPSVISGNLAPGQAMIQGGQGLTGLSQQRIADQMARFYGEQNAPWDTATRYANLVGQPTTGSSSQTTPVLGPNGLSSAIGTLGGINSAFGQGGALSGLFGGGAGGAVAPWALDAAGSSVGADAAAALGSSAIDFGGGGGGLAAALPFAATVICTELRRQDRMPKRYYIAAARADAKIPQIVRAGYHAWAIPSVRHLRRKPNSLYSRLLAKTFNWRAEDLAARAGVKGARKLWQGRMVTAALALPCLALGLLCRKADLAGLYDAHKAPL